MEEIPPGILAHLGPDERRTVRRCLSVLALLSSASLAGVASWLYLVNHAPLLLIALSPIGRHLILVAPIVDPVSFVFVGVGRRPLVAMSFLFYRPSRSRTAASTPGCPAPA